MGAGTPAQTPLQCYNTRWNPCWNHLLVLQPPFLALKTPSSGLSNGDTEYHLMHHLQAATMVPVPWQTLHEEDFRVFVLASVSPHLKWPTYGIMHNMPNTSAPSLRGGEHSSLLLPPNWEVLVGPLLPFLPLLSHVLQFALYLYLLSFGVLRSPVSLRAPVIASLRPLPDS